MPGSHPLLKPYEPSEADPFDSVKASHLLNRATFGGTLPEVNQAMARGPVATVDALLDFPDKGIDEIDEHKGPDLTSIEGYPRSFRDIARLYLGKSDQERKILFVRFMIANASALKAMGDWWAGRMTHGPHPMQEKLTLFWHGHFTTSAKDEKAARLIWVQNDLLRKHAAGNFTQFVKAISRDPAMLDYLNNQQNHKNHANENYARELMELFTLGIGNYSEADVKNAARAFTGWSHDGYQFVFRQFDHDDGEKTFFGDRGNFDGDDIVDRITRHPACATHIARKLFTFFVYENPESELIEALAGELRENHFELRPVLKTLFTSRAFYSDKAIGAQIKSPVQLVIGTLRQLGVSYTDLADGERKNLYGALEMMGQLPLHPPNVKGWPGGRSWISTSTLFVRYNTCVALAAKADLIAGHSAEKMVDYWVSRLIQRPIDATQRQSLLTVAGAKPTVESLRRVVQLIVSTPEYQLC